MAERMIAGARVWVRGLETQMEYNGLEGVIFDGPCPYRVYVRLDQGNTQLCLKKEHVFCIDNIPVFTTNSPLYMNPDRRILSDSRALEICIEPGKGQGVRATQLLHNGDRVMKKGEQSKVVLNMPSVTGCAYVLGKNCTDKNIRQYHDVAIGELIDAIHFHLKNEDKVCTDETRYTGKFCGFGGCGLCGLAILTTGALKYASVEKMRDPKDYFNVWGRQLHIDQDMILSNLQLNEIILIVDFICGETDGLSSETRRDFAAYVWNLVGVWKTNAVAYYMPLTVLEELVDPKTAEMKKDTHVHLKSWGHAITVYSEGLQENGITENGLGLMARMIEGLSFLDENKKPYEKAKGNVLAHAVVTCLHQSFISKINGAKSTDVPNCSFKTYIHCPGGGVDIEKDMHCFIMIEQETAAGEYLCVSYNNAGLKDYFTRSPEIAVAAQIVESPLLHNITQSIVNEFEEYLPAYLVKYLQKALSEAHEKKKIVYRGI